MMVYKMYYFYELSSYDGLSNVFLLRNKNVKFKGGYFATLLVNSLLIT